MKLNTVTFFALLAIAVAACGETSEASGPPDIQYGRDICVQCGMIINEEKFAAAYTLNDGTEKSFDDVGGLVLQPTQPEVDPFNFLPRATVPTRMVNLPNDYFYPEATSQEPFYQLLGAGSKDRVVLKGGHGHRLPMNIIVKESLDWFEQYLPQ